MLDKRLIRESPDDVKDALSKRDPALTALVDQVLKLDALTRQLKKRVDELRAMRNTVSKEIGDLQKSGRKDVAQEKIEYMRSVSDEIKAEEAKMEVVESDLDQVFHQIPNIPHPTVPFGYKESDKKILKVWGEPKKFSFKPRDHVQMAAKLRLIDFEAGARVSGSGFYFFTGTGARLQRALIDFMLDIHREMHGYTEIGPPFVTLPAALFGTGQLPKMADDMYQVEADELFLIPTAEVPVTNFFRESIIEDFKWPVKFAAYSACFRREAGSYGKETKGLIRVHQFDKVELVNFTVPHNSYECLETLTSEAEKILELLELTYRRVVLPTGDMSFASAKTYDLEVHCPADDAWREVSSCSNYEDFQARRAAIRYRDKETRKVEFVHTLNGSALALPRLIVALLETYQREDGAVVIPRVLRKYFGNLSVITPAE
jgi:seryl-tRNA synthetase